MHQPLCKQVRHPLEPHPHDVDVNALLCIAVVYNISIACNRHAAVDASGYRPVHNPNRTQRRHFVQRRRQADTRGLQEASRCTRKHS